MRCSLQKLRKEAEEELKALVDGNGMESEINLKKGEVEEAEGRNDGYGASPKGLQEGATQGNRSQHEGLVAWCPGRTG